MTFKIIYILYLRLGKSCMLFRYFAYLSFFGDCEYLFLSFSARIIIFPKLTNPQYFIDPPSCRRDYTRRRTRLIRAWIAHIFTLAWGCTRDASRTWRKKKDPSMGNNPRIEPRALLSPTSRKRNASAVTSQKKLRENWR